MEVARTITSPTLTPEPFWGSSLLSQGTWCHLVVGRGMGAWQEQDGAPGRMDTREMRRQEAVHLPHQALPGASTCPGGCPAPPWQPSW